MPNIKSAKKRVKITQIQTMRNKAAKSDLKTAIKKANAAIESNDNIDVTVTAAIRTIDQAVRKNILHKNTAARRKSSLMKKAAAVSH